MIVEVESEADVSRDVKGVRVVFNITGQWLRAVTTGAIEWAREGESPEVELLEVWADGKELPLDCLSQSDLDRLEEMALSEYEDMIA